MPDIDVIDALLDPDVCDTSLVCERNTQTVSSGGMTQNATKLIPFSGVAYPETGNRLRRNADGERIEGAITVITPFTLIAGDETHTADIVQWLGERYTVVEVQPYTSYGRGFAEALCERISLSS